MVLCGSLAGGSIGEWFVRVFWEWKNEYEGNKLIDREGLVGESCAVREFLREPISERFSPVVEEHIGMVRKLAYRILLNEHDADDVTQETFISAFHGIGSFRGGSRFRTWLLRIAHNKCCSLLRSRRRRSHESLDMPGICLRGPKSLHPDSRMNSGEAHDRIHRAISSLPVPLRAALVLISIDGTPIEDAVYILKCNRATVYWRLHKARRLVRRALDAEDVNVSALSQ